MRGNPTQTVDRRLNQPHVTCRLAVFINIFLVALIGDFFFLCGFRAFYRLHRKKQRYSFIQVSLLVADVLTKSDASFS